MHNCICKFLIGLLVIMELEVYNLIGKFSSTVQCAALHSKISITT